MVSSLGAEVDFIEELRMRRWAREHYVPLDRRETNWHPVVLDEMQRKGIDKFIRENDVSQIPGRGFSGRILPQPTWVPTWIPSAM